MPWFYCRIGKALVHEIPGCPRGILRLAIDISDPQNTTRLPPRRKNASPKKENAYLITIFGETLFGFRETDGEQGALVDGRRYFHPAVVRL